MKLFTHRLLIILFACVGSLTAKGQLTANFTADVTAGCAPLVVHFHNTTTPASGTTFDWDLGNGTGIIHLTDPSGTYLTPGTTYTVRLTAHNGSSTSTRTMTITVYPSPTVSFTASDTTICPGSSVTFTSSSLGGVPGPVTCTWNYGDGFSGTGTTSTHTYTASGFYNVTLSVTNADGCVASLTKVSYIEVYTPAAVFLTAATTYFCTPPGNAVFTNMTTGFGPFSYVWRFGDGSPTSTVTNPLHTYPLPGSYTVTLQVTDGHGCTDSLVLPGYIGVGSLRANFIHPATACVNSVVMFPNTSSAHTSSSWDFGDLGTGSTDTGYHIYTVPGTYNVRLIVYDGHCYDTITYPITIVPGPAASFSISPTNPCPPPTTLTFTGTVPSGTTVRWLYGDGTGGTGTTSSHTYWRRGIYSIQMICTSSMGCIDTITRLDTLYDMVHWISVDNYSGCKPLSVTFTPHMMTWMTDTLTMHPYPFPVTSYSWNFGDGSPVSPSPTPTHIFTAVGTYAVVLTSITSNGCTVHDTVTIHVGQPPIVTFIATPLHQCYRNNNITFIATIVSGPVDSFMWVYGDNEGDITRTPGASHHFIRPGFFSATVTPYYNGCPGPPYVLPTIITIDSPQAIIKDSVYCSPRRRVAFADSSLGDDTHMWIFGDGATSTLDNPIHDYASDIVYVCSLATYNIRSGCRDTAIINVDLRRPVTTFSTPDTAICKNDPVVFTATTTGGVIIDWIWGHPGPFISGSPVVPDTFWATGIYDIKLFAKDPNQCWDTIIRPHYMLVAKPDAHFTVAPPIGCWPLTSIFTDASTDVPGTFFTNFDWWFGDGGTAFVTTPSVSHTFTSAGSFTTKEIVTDNVGCKDTVEIPSVTVWRPSAVFTCNNVHPCRYDAIHFTNTSTGIVGSFWMFGDGDTSTLNSPWHAYRTAGTFTVKLVVTDVHGCTDTATYVNYISIIQPVASFYMDDSVSICPPLMVHFHNTTTGALYFYWSLGDGTSSTAVNPSDLYITPGYDTVRLIASNIYGCKDTVYGHVNIFGYNGAFRYSPLTGCAPLTVNFYATTLNVPNIIWDFADGNTSHLSYSDTAQHVYLQPGAYVPKLILSDNSGCQNSSIGLDTIKVDAVYPGFKIYPNPICVGDSFKLVDSSWSYWSTITGLSWSVNGINSSIDSPTIFIPIAGTFPVSHTDTDGWGCVATVVKDITIHPLPIIKASKDTIICVGDPATLFGSGGVSYTWAPPATLSCTACNPTLATPSVITNYTVTGTDGFGCKNTDTVSVYLITKTESRAWGDSEVCAGSPVPLFDSGGTKFTWLPPTWLNDTHIQNPISTPQSSIKYMVISQLGSCIPDTNFVTIIVHPMPYIEAGPDQTLIAGSQAHINTTSKYVYKYMWDHGETLDCDTCANPVASMSVTTTYHIDVATDFGCRGSDSITIHLFCDESQIFIPNSFTPNKDGENDVFYPRGTGISNIKSFRIYNRWGQLLFERSNIDINDEKNAWDGSFHGDGPRPDVYVYVIEAICETGEPFHLKGDVTIIR